MTDSDSTSPGAAKSFAQLLATIKSGESPYRSEELETAAGYLERSMAQLRVCIAALKYEGSALALDIASKLDEDVHNDIDVAREIFQDWYRREQQAPGD